MCERNYLVVWGRSCKLMQQLGIFVHSTFWCTTGWEWLGRMRGFFPNSCTDRYSKLQFSSTAGSCSDINFLHTWMYMPKDNWNDFFIRGGQGERAMWTGTVWIHDSHATIAYYIVELFASKELWNSSNTESSHALVPKQLGNSKVLKKLKAKWNASKIYSVLASSIYRLIFRCIYRPSNPRVSQGFSQYHLAVPNTL